MPPTADTLSVAATAGFVQIARVANKQSLPGRRSQAESARTCERILERAERLFAREGYRGVTTREVARAAGVHHYTVQYHFESKLGLFEAVLCRWDEAVRPRKRPAA